MHVCLYSIYTIYTSTCSWYKIFQTIIQQSSLSSLPNIYTRCSPGNQLLLISRDRPAQSLRRTVFTKSVSVSTGKAQTIKWNVFVQAALISESFRAAMLLLKSHLDANGLCYRKGVKSTQAVIKDQKNEAMRFLLLTSLVANNESWQHSHILTLKKGRRRIRVKSKWLNCKPQFPLTLTAPAGAFTRLASLWETKYNPPSQLMSN